MHAAQLSKEASAGVGERMQMFCVDVRSCAHVHAPGYSNVCRSRPLVRVHIHLGVVFFFENIQQNGILFQWQETSVFGTIGDDLVAMDE